MRNYLILYTIAFFLFGNVLLEHLHVHEHHNHKDNNDCIECIIIDSNAKTLLSLNKFETTFKIFSLINFEYCSFIQNNFFKLFSSRAPPIS